MLDFPVTIADVHGFKKRLRQATTLWGSSAMARVPYTFVGIRVSGRRGEPRARRTNINDHLAEWGFCRFSRTPNSWMQDVWRALGSANPWMIARRRRYNTGKLVRAFSGLLRASMKALRYAAKDTFYRSRCWYLLILHCIIQCKYYYSLMIFWLFKSMFPIELSLLLQCQDFNGFFIFS